MDTIPIINLKGVGEKTAKLFNKLDVYTVNDLYSYFPRSYEKFNAPVEISKLNNGEAGTIYAKVFGKISLKKIRNLSILNVNVQDSSGVCQLTFFNMPYLSKILISGTSHIFRGIPHIKNQTIKMEQPKIYTYDEYKPLVDKLLPIYPLTKGITNNFIQKCVKGAFLLDLFEEDYLPLSILNNYELSDLKTSIQAMHFPKNLEDLSAYRRRLVFDEFFDFCYILQCNKSTQKNLPNNYRMFENAETVKFLERLPFSLTKAQKKVWGEIKNDFEGKWSMNRLIQGDVGSGKTIIAILSLLLTCANGHQCALMAPTEVLARQHFEDISKMTTEYDLCFKIELLVGSTSAKQKKLIYEKCKNGEINLIIGTHALIQEKVEYKDLALVITDEQHRFGVKQREALFNKGNSPHVCVMSATPIPRTLAIIMYGDLDISIIDELPANRLPIKNCLVDTNFRKKAYDFIAKEVKAGHQAYVICPMVEAGEDDTMENVIDYSQKLEAYLSNDIRVEYLHGKMPPAKKDKIMEEFSAGQIQVLVSTTVIEVGINVPNATVMLIENSEHFGLAQLHQLRGRVGRGDAQSYCIFISSKNDKKTVERLGILTKSNDGFFVASEDLRLRGPGELFGVRQSGELSFKYGDIYQDSKELKQANEAVQFILSSDPQLEKEENRKLKQHFNSNYKNLVDLRTI